MTKYICVHIHLFKNAGSTIDWALERNFRKSFKKLDDVQNPGNIIKLSELLDFLDENPKVKAISSHQFRITDFISFPGVIKPFLFLRNPIDRAFSVYYFDRRSNETFPGATKASKMNLKQYIEWRLRQKFGIIANFQTLCLSWNDEISKEQGSIEHINLKKAKENMKRYTFIGVVERLDESLVLAEHLLKPFFGKLDLSYVSKNVTQERKKSLNQRIDDDCSVLGKELTEKLFRMNEFDMELHRIANISLDEKIRTIPDFHAQLNHFRKRCNRLKRRLI